MKHSGLSAVFGCSVSVAPGWLQGLIARASAAHEARVLVAMRLVAEFGVNIDDARFALFLAEGDLARARQLLEHFVARNAWPSEARS